MFASTTFIRRFLTFLFGGALFALGGWLLYRHLLFGDQFSIGLTFTAMLMAGSGMMILPTTARRGW
jgi:hypothetical protein